MAADEAINYIQNHSIIGVGTGSTVHYFIEALGKIRHKIEGCVASSINTEQKLKALGIPLLQLNDINALPIYIDSCDEFNQHRQLIKGGGGALTREKILAYAAKEFICIANIHKEVQLLGKFPVAVEVIPMARSLVAREIIKLGGDPVYRQGFITDNGNIILDVFNLDITNPTDLEKKINQITGVVENGIFSHKTPIKIIIAAEEGVRVI